LSVCSSIEKAGYSFNTITTILPKGFKMKLMNKDRLMISKINRIAEVIPESKLTLVLGLPGSGKTTSVLKALVGQGIKPIWFNYDESDTPLDTEKDIHMFNGEYALDLVLGNIEDLKDEVILIDTYERFWEQFIHWNLSKDRKDRYTTDELKHLLVNLLETRCKEGLTVLVLAHPEEYVGRDGIFKDNPVLARRAYEIISFETRLSTSVKELRAGNGTSHFMYLKKARAFTGNTTYMNWMRD
jgi:hypothetical protein